jgi:hypothetical protein
LDQERHPAGRRVLGRWLDEHAGDGPRWVHLQWHMLVFELGIGDWHAAHRRYRRAILPVARETDAAITDGPQALLRLCWAAPEPVALPWRDASARAVARLEAEGSPFERLHDLLAVAGARDLDVIDWWLSRRAASQTRGLDDAAAGIRAFATRDDRRAVSLLERAVPTLSSWGGSRAQNELFIELLRVAQRRVHTSAPWQSSRCLSAPA